MRVGIEKKREWLRERLSWRMNVDALDDEQVRAVYNNERLHDRLRKLAEGYSVQIDRQARHAIADVTDSHVITQPYDPDMITVTFVEPDNG